MPRKQAFLCAQCDTNRFRTSAIGKQQSGQALILAVVCLLVLCLGFLAVFDTGQVVTKKEQLVNASDAAAYSVGIEQARALNTVAYFNRAEVANQIFIAQLVSLQSYANYADSLTGRFANLLAFAGEALTCCGGEALVAAAELIKEGQQVYAGALVGEDKAMDLIVRLVNGVNFGYSKGQAFVLKGFSVESGFSTAEKVVQANTVDASGSSHAMIPGVGKGLLAIQLGCFDGVQLLCHGTGAITANEGYAIRYKIPIQKTASDDTRAWAADRYANLVMEARDAFSTARNGNIGFGVPWLFKISTVKRGGTDLVDYNRWVAVDDLSLNVKIGPCKFLLPCIKLHGLTFGLGAAAALPSQMAMDSSSSIISPGISLTKGAGVGKDYQPGTGAGWYSPYTGGVSQPYQNALHNVAAGADVAAHPTDQGNYDFLADLSWLLGSEYPVPNDATPKRVAWLPTEASGLQNYNDVAPGKAVQPYATGSKDDGEAGPIFTVFVQQPDKTVRTGANIGMEDGKLKLKDQGIGGAISAVSSARVYYDRPWWNLAFLSRHTSTGSNNGKRELGNLFEPYWQVRLVPTPTSIKAILVGAQMAGL